MKRINQIISVVIPLFNREKLIAETLDSVLVQSFVDWECIVVDDGSTDGSVAVVEEYAKADSRIRLLVRPDDRIKGAPTCRNIGLKNAGGEYVHFLDSDDLIDPELYQTILDRIANEDGADYVSFPYDGFLTTSESPVFWSQKYNPRKGSLFEQLFLGKVGRQTSSLLWRRSFLEKQCLFWREGLIAGQDTEFGARALCHAGRGIWLDIPRMFHLRRSNMDSIMAQYKINPEEKIKATLPLSEENYLLCKKCGKMTLRLHRQHLMRLLRAQLKFSVLFGYVDLSRCYGVTISRIATASFSDRFCCVLSHLVALTTPFLYACGLICCRLPYLGTKFKLAKTR